MTTSKELTACLAKHFPGYSATASVEAYHYEHDGGEVSNGVRYQVAVQYRPHSAELWEIATGSSLEDAIAKVKAARSMKVGKPKPQPKPLEVLS